MLVGCFVWFIIHQTVNYDLLNWGKYSLKSLKLISLVINEFVAFLFLIASDMERIEVVSKPNSTIGLCEC